MIKPKCAVCQKRSGGVLVEYPTILQSMGYVGHKLAHTKCIIKIQQESLRFRTRLSTR